MPYENLKPQLAVLSISGNQSNGLGREELELLEDCVFKNLNDFKSNLFNTGCFYRLKNDLSSQDIKIEFYNLTDFTQSLNDQDIDIEDSWIISFYIKQ